MRIVVDADLPFLEEMFAGKAEVVRLKASAIDAAAVAGADALIARSVTRIDERLLGGSRATFAGTATIGTDHADLEWLARRGIAFASAPGSNATAVSEYLAAALLELSLRLRRPLSGMTLGIVGCGNVGRRVARKAAALGMTVLVNDPPLERAAAGAELDAAGASRFSPIDALMECDVVSLHVPLTRSGSDSTWRLFGGDRLGAMKPGSVLINTSRGAVVDPPALANVLDSGRLAGAVIDVWEGEPAVDPELPRRATIATAHVAGYSADARLRAAAMMHEAACAHFGWIPSPVSPDRLPPADPAVIDPRAWEGSGGRDPRSAPDPWTPPRSEEILRRIVRIACPILRDDADFRRHLDLPAERRPAEFIRLRNEYPARREFPAITVKADGSKDFPAAALAGLGFRVE